MKNIGTQTLETKRLILRRWTKEDAGAMYENYASNPQVTKFMSWPRHENIETSQYIVNEWVNSYSKDNYYEWAIVPKDIKQPIGSIGAVRVDEDLSLVHVGYCIGSKWWHRGITSEAFAAVIDFFFERVGVERIESQHDPRNPHSGGVMRKCGLKYEGTLRSAYRNNQGICDASYYGLLRSERFLVSKNTINYYNTNAKTFSASTVSVEFTHMQNRFLNKLSKGAIILDFGCGSGRDTKFFLEKGYHVDATDGSENLCAIASEYTGIKVKNMLFQELTEVNKYDGIWACSSILHLPVDELTEVMEKMTVALKEKGVIYTSFKYGTFAGERNGRFFTDMTEETFADFLSNIEDLEVEEQWTTKDVRPGRGEEKWLNLILRKK